MNAFTRKIDKKMNDGMSGGVLFLFGIFFVATTILSDLPLASLVALCGFALFGLYACIVAPAFLVKYFVFLFGILAAIVGCFSCEFLGGYLPELRITSSFSGSLPLLILNYFTFLTCLYLFDKKLGKEDYCKLGGNHIYDEGKWFKWVHFGIIAMFAIMLLHVLPNPAFINGNDRFSYADLYLAGIWRYLHSASMILYIIPLLAIRFGYKKSGVLAIVIRLSYLFCTGIKFSGFYALLGVGTLVFYDKIITLGKRVIFRALASLFIVLVGLIGFSVFAHSFANSSDSPSQFFFNRTAQQGQLWWSTYKDYSPGEGFHEFSDEIEGLSFGQKAISESVGDQYGIYKIMYLNAPADLVDRKLESGSRYTEAAYASVYYYFGTIGTLLFSVLTAFATVLLINLMIRVIHRREILPSVACLVIWMAWGTFRSMFLFSALLAPSVIFCFWIIFLFSRKEHLSLDHKRHTLEKSFVDMEKS